jgi:hypothetical protein
MNVQANKLATQAIITSLKKDKFLNVITNPFCKAYLRDGKMYRSNKETEHLQRKWKGKEMRAYFKKRFTYDEPTMRDLNWTALAMARTQTNKTTQRSY